MTTATTRLLTCPTCFFGQEIAAANIPADGREFRCPKCSHRWQLARSPQTGGNDSGIPGPDTKGTISLAPRASVTPATPAMSDIFREEADQARRMRELRRARRPPGAAPEPVEAAPARTAEAEAAPEGPEAVPEPDLPAGPSAESPEADQGRSSLGDMRWTLVLLALLAVLWLSYEFDEWLAEAVPALKPLLEQYHSFVSGLGR